MYNDYGVSSGRGLRDQGFVTIEIIEVGVRFFRHLLTEETKGCFAVTFPRTLLQNFTTGWMKT
jgi:hypothetical protein